MQSNSISSRILRILVIVVCSLLINSQAQINNPTSCLPSSCGNIRNIRYPFRLSSEPRQYCGYNNPHYELDCLNNQTILRSGNKHFYVQEIDYDYYSIRLVDPNINRTNLSSCPFYPNGYGDWPLDSMFGSLLDWNIPVAFIHCLNPVNSTRYVRAAFCGNRSNIFGGSQQEIYSYVVVGNVYNPVSELEESCTVDRVDWASARRPWRDNSSLASIYDGLGYGFELSWYRILCGECERTYGSCSLEGNTIRCRHYCPEDVPIEKLDFRCQFQYWGLIYGGYGMLVIAGILGLRFLLGFPFLVGLVIYKWRRRHLSIDENCGNGPQSE